MEYSPANRVPTNGTNDLKKESRSPHQELRSAFGSYVTGVTVVTTRSSDGIPVGFTANSFTSVSLEPALLLVCVGKNTSSYNIFQRTNTFAVNILGSDQKELAQRFARHKGDRFEGIDWEESAMNNPLLGGSCAWFDCSLFNRVDAGDHDVMIGKIHTVADHGRNGLGYFRHDFFSTDRRIVK